MLFSGKLPLLMLACLLPPLSAQRITDPEGPPIAAARTLADGAAVAQPDGGGRFVVTFPAGHGKPAVTFSLRETALDDRLGVALDVTNLGRRDIRVYAELNGNIWVRGFADAAPGKPATVYVFLKRKSFNTADAARFPKMHGLPGGKMSLWDGMEQPVRVHSLKLFVIAGPRAARIRAGNIRAFGSARAPDTASLLPFIDKYGQYKHKDWPGKIHSDNDFNSALEREDADLAAHSGPEDFDRYGGWAAGPKLKATGHFRVEKLEGKWWLVDPDGRLFWSNGVDCVNLDDKTSVEGRESYFEEPAPDGNFLIRNLAQKYGAEWRQAAIARNLRRLKSWGLNTIGAWSDPAFTDERRVPYTVILHSRTDAQRGPDSEAWEEGLRQSMQFQAARLDNDPWCIGVFVDNEIHASRDPDWFERYYRKVGALARQYLPHKLYLGSRLDFHEWPDETEARRSIVRSAAKYCDVVSFNLYRYTVENVTMPEGTDRPVLIGEFHIGALDRGMFHTGLRSAADQNQRAAAYRTYVKSALANPVIVGAHWFKLYDEPTTGRYDGENYQIGFLDGCDTPYAETIAAVRAIGYHIYRIRAGGEHER